MASLLIVLVNMVACGNLAAIGVALPALATDLDVPPAHALWIADAFLVASVCATPLTPFLLERLDARRLLLVGVAGTMASSAPAAAAPALLPLGRRCTSRARCGRGSRRDGPPAGRCR